jgi:hypothetical protein
MIEVFERPFERPKQQILGNLKKFHSYNRAAGMQVVNS